MKEKKHFIYLHEEQAQHKSNREDLDLIQEQHKT